MSANPDSETYLQCKRLIESIDPLGDNRQKLQALGSLPDVSVLDFESLTALLTMLAPRLNGRVAGLSRETHPGNHSTASAAPYDRHFYDEQRDASRRSACEMVPKLVELLAPRRVVDVGCGVGTWLSIFIENGVPDVLGIDGAWVEESMLLIPDNRFMRWDLQNPITIGEKFDLAISLEVAEHLPSEFADTFVASLCSLAPAVCFSAAIPFQGGTEHLNEQWPGYWIERFHRHGYECLDVFRDRFWSNNRVLPYYSQNAFLFCNRDTLQHNHQLAKATRLDKDVCPYIHPKLFLRAIFNELKAGLLSSTTRPL